MAQTAVHLDTKTFSCFLCERLLRDPVAIPCGHTYCHGCIERHWEEDRRRGIQDCPRCRKRFKTRPELLRNTMIAAVVEQLRNGEVKGSYAGAEDVACDVCTGRKLKAAKFCVVCAASYCETHLQPHRDAAPLRRHPLVEPSKNLEENICSRFDEQCVLQDACGSVATARQEKSSMSAESVRRRIEDKERELRDLQDQVEELEQAFEDAEGDLGVYSLLISEIKKRRFGVEKRIRSQQEVEARRVKELQETLEREVAQLRSKDADLQKLSRTKDHCVFLHGYTSASTLPGSAHSGLRRRTCRYFDAATTAASESGEKIFQLLLNTRVNPLLNPADASQPRTHADFLGYSSAVTLDQKTVHKNMRVSEEDRRATWTGKNKYPDDHPVRSQMGGGQVLSKEALPGCSYWEVKIIKGSVKIGVVYKQKGPIHDRPLGTDGNSCSLLCYEPVYEFFTDMGRTRVEGAWSDTVGVYLDQRAGLLSFYSVCGDSMGLVHRVQASFAEPLHARLWISCGSSAELVKLG